jgi:hypothetical protein
MNNKVVPVPNGTLPVTDLLRISSYKILTKDNNT